MLYEADQPAEYAYFLDSGIASIVAETGGSKIEVGIYGFEGMGGISLLLDVDRTPFKHFMQVSGTGHRIAASALLDAIEASRPLHMFLLRYVQVFGLQTSLTAVANGTAFIGERLARWLLMYQDRLNRNDLKITHDFLATMLGVRRPGVTEAINQLEGEGLIKATRGRIQVLNRAKLLSRAGSSYGIPEAEYRRLIGALN